MSATNYFHYDSVTGDVIGVGFTPDGTVPSSCIACSDSQASNPQQFHIDLSGSSPVIAAASQAKLDALTSAQLRADAIKQLDIVTGPRGQVIRAVAAGVSLTSEWQNYIISLRNISNGSDALSTSLPVKPAFIPGT